MKMVSITALKRTAKQKVKENRKSCIVASLLYIAACSICVAISGAIGSGAESTNGDMLPGAVTFLLTTMVIGPTVVGIYRFFAANAKASPETRRDVDSSVYVLSGFSKQFGRTVIANMIRSIYLSLWTLLFVIPGIVKMYSYRMTDYILATNDGISAKEAINESRRLMNGHKLEAFLLDLSFFGWTLLGVLTLGIVFAVYVFPYKTATEVEFFNTIASESESTQFYQQ
jgi:uncharacterized membrane protein